MSRAKRSRGQRRASLGAGYEVPATPWISFYCSSKGNHEKWRIGTVAPEEFNGQIYWGEIDAYYDPALATSLPIARSMGQYLVGDRWVSRTDHGARHDPSFRIRWNLRCGICGLSRTIATPRDIFPKLAAATTLGIREIELAALV